METFWGPDLERWFGDSARLAQFGTVVAQEVDPLVYQLEREGPTTDGSGVRFHPAYAQAGRAVWASGILGAEPLEQAGLFFLLTHAGEGGHACPVTCTAGLIRALRLHGSDEMRERFLPPLLETDYDRLPAWCPVPDGGARRLGRGREPHACRARRRRLAAARREVVLLGGRRRSVRRHGAA